MIDIAQDHLQRAIVEHDNILENEHETLEFLREFRVINFKGLNDGFLCRAVNTIEHLDDGFDTASRGKVLGDERREFPLQHALYLSYDLRRCAIHHRYAFCDFSLTLLQKGNNDNWNGPISGVNEVRTAAALNTVYSIDGRRVSSMNRPGLYIITENGRARKVMK